MSYVINNINPRDGFLNTQDKTRVSDYMSYSSYSGADIKVVVHYPSVSRDQRILEKQKAQLEVQREQDLAGFFAMRENMTTKELAVAVDRQNRFRSDLDNIDTHIEEMQNRPTSKVLAELQTISMGSFREKSPVRTLGSVYPKGFTRGPRCIPASEKVYIKDKGLISIADVQVGDYVQSSGFDFNKVLGSYIQGEKECYLLKLRNGYSIKASYDHPIYTSRGWVNMEDLIVEDDVFVCGNTPCHQNEYNISDSVLKLIGYLIGDGTTRIYNYDGKICHRIGLSIADSEMDTIGQDVQECLDDLNIGFSDTQQQGSITRAIHVCTKGHGATDWRLREYNSLHRALLKFNLYNKYSHTKEIPQEFIHGFSERQIILFLRCLLATDGGYSISVGGDKEYIRFFYCSTSENLIDQIRLLLSKLGLNALKHKENKIGKVGGIPSIISKHDAFRLRISDSLELVRFVKRVGIYGKDRIIQPYLSSLIFKIRSHNLDIEPKEFHLIAKKYAQKSGVPMPRFNGCNLNNYKISITPHNALKVAGVMKNGEFSLFVEELINKLINQKQDLISFKAVSIDKIGKLSVYDLEVEDRHCFICNFIKVHNSVAGSMIFTIFHEHALHELMRMNLRYYSTGTSDFDKYLYTTMLADQLPPLDISLIFANEYGAISHMGLWGVEFFQEGMTFSIEDIFSESTVQWVARDFDPMRIVQVREIDGQGVTKEWAYTASNLIEEDKLLNGHLYRRNPFI